MKTWFSILCLGTLSLHTYAEQKNVDSAISNVTVYNDRAAIERHTEINLPAGKHQLTFTKLPANIDTNSLQVSVIGTVPSTIIDVTSYQQNLTNPANNRLKEINEQIQTLKRQLTQLDDQSNIVNNQLTFFKQAQNIAISTNKTMTRPSVAHIQEIMQLSENTLSELLSEQRVLKAKQALLYKQLQVLTNENTSLQRLNNQQTKNVTVSVDLEKAGKLALNLTYITYGAYWQPIYDAKVSSKERKVSLNYLALISQKTGEDWSNVKLTLSTARPSFGANVPKLTDWKLSEFNPNLINSKNKDLLLAGATTRSYEKTKPQPVTVDMGSTSATFNISEPTSLLSNGQQQKVMITTIDLTSKLQYQVTPRLKQTAYLQADTINNSDYPLLAGQLNIFMDDRFITSSSLKTTMPNEHFKLDLGGDEAIAVTYKKLKNYTEKTGIINSNQRITYDSLITIQNNKATTETLSINDHIPVSQNEKITVTLLSHKKGATQDKEGKLTWNLSLTPNEKIEIPVTFSVEYPINTKITGL